MFSGLVKSKTARGGGVVLLASALCFCGLIGAEASLYREGEKVELRGVVTDAEGLPLPDMTVQLEIGRYAFDWRKFRKTKSHVHKAATTTDPSGAYAFEWTWYDYYNDFQLTVGMNVRDADLQERFQTLHRESIGPRVALGSPVVVDLIVRDSPFLDTRPSPPPPTDEQTAATTRESASETGSDDERRIREEMGQPDRVQTLEYPDYDEVTWWYFEKGKAYRFREGKLQQVVRFEPVTPMDSN